MPNRPRRKNNVHVLKKQEKSLFAGAKAILDAGLGDVGVTITKHGVNLMGLNEEAESSFDVSLTWAEIAEGARENNTSVEQFLLAVMIANARAAGQQHVKQKTEPCQEPSSIDDSTESS